MAHPKGRTSAGEGYRGHRPGSRKGEVHKAFDQEGPAAARARADELGLKPATFPNWAVHFRRQAGTEGKPARVPVNVSLDAALVAAAKEFDVNVSRAAELGVAEEVSRVIAERWLKENRAAIESSNEFAGKHGLPLAKHRMF